MIHIWNILKGKQSHKWILPSFLLTSFLSSIWQNGSHFVGEKEKQSQTGCSASEGEGHLEHPFLSPAMSNDDCLPTVCTVTWNRQLLGDVVPALRGLQSDKKSKNSGESQNKPQQNYTLKSQDSLC